MKYFIYFAIVSFCLGCDDEKGSWILPPNQSLMLSFSDTAFFDTKYSLSTLDGKLIMEEDSLICYYVDGKKQYFGSSVVRVQNGPDGKPFYPYYRFTSGDIHLRSANNGIKQFFIEWPNGQVDTLFANYRSDTKGPNDCSCSEPLVELTLNGKSFIEKTDYSINGVYVFE